FAQTPARRREPIDRTISIPPNLAADVWRPLIAASHRAGHRSQTTFRASRSWSIAAHLMKCPPKTLVNKQQPATPPVESRFNYSTKQWKERTAPFAEYDLDMPPIQIRRSELASPDAVRLIGALNLELTGVFPEPGATHFGLSDADVAPGEGAF